MPTRFWASPTAPSFWNAAVSCTTATAPRSKPTRRCLSNMSASPAVPARSGVRRTADGLLRRLLPDFPLLHQRDLLVDHVFLVVGMLAGDLLEIKVLRIDRLL